MRWRSKERFGDLAAHMGHVHPLTLEIMGEKLNRIRWLHEGIVAIRALDKQAIELCYN